MRKRHKIGVREFKNQAARILSQVREDGAEYVVTRRGKPVALVTPYPEDQVDEDLRRKQTKALERLRKTASRVAAVASKESASAAVSRQRR